MKTYSPLLKAPEQEPADTQDTTFFFLLGFTSQQGL